MRSREFLHSLRNYWLPKEESAPWGSLTNGSEVKFRACVTFLHVGHLLALAGGYFQVAGYESSLLYSHSGSGFRDETN